MIAGGWSDLVWRYEDYVPHAGEEDEVPHLSITSNLHTQSKRRLHTHLLKVRGC